LVVSADVPPQDGETDEQRQKRENANAARAVRRQQELAAPAQVQVSNQFNNQLTPDKPMTMLVNKYLGASCSSAATPAAPQQRCHDDQPRASRLRERDLLRDFECDDLEVYNSPQTDLGAALAALNHLEDSPVVRHLQANVRVATAVTP
jgi:hypothetical protein